MKKVTLVIFILTTLLCGQAIARSSNGVVLSASGMYLIGNITNGNSTTNSSRTLGDGLLGYRFSSPILVGAQYGYDSTSTSTTSTTTDTYNSYGATAGFDNGNFFVLGTYYIGSTFDDVVGNTTDSYTGGSGYQGTIGYRFNVTSHFGIGPQLSYRYLSYSSKSVGGAPATSVTYNYTTFLPYINFTYSFGSGSSSDD